MRAPFYGPLACAPRRAQCCAPLAGAARGRGGFAAQTGFVTVALAWVAISVFGAMPFWLSGAIPYFVDALFETVSGFTTTGASILSDVEVLGRGMLYWRSFTHWLGGMGILVFTLAIVNMDKNAGTMNLMRAESPGPSVGRFTPRLGQTARILYAIYFAMTVLCVLFLLAGGMPLFDSLCTAFGTAGTGGFGIKNDSMASYSPLPAKRVHGVHAFVRREFQRILPAFAAPLRTRFARRRGAVVFWRVFRGRACHCVEYPSHDGKRRPKPAPCVFQVSSVMTTTGFSTVDFNLWPSFSKAVLLCLMVLGACAGSGGGGIKVVRAILLLKGLRRNVHRTPAPPTACAWCT